MLLFFSSQEFMAAYLELLSIDDAKTLLLTIEIRSNRIKILSKFKMKFAAALLASMDPEEVALYLGTDITSARWTREILVLMPNHIANSVISKLPVESPCVSEVCDGPRYGRSKLSRVDSDRDVLYNPKEGGEEMYKRYARMQQERSGIPR